MAIAFQNSTTVHVALANTGTLNVPASTSDGDFLVVVISQADGGANPTLNGSWTQIVSESGLPDHDILNRVYYRRASSEPASYTITLNADAPYARYVAATMMRFTGVLASGDPIRTTGVDSPTSIGTPKSTPSLTGVQTGDLTLHTAATARSNWGVTTTYEFTNPGGWTELVNAVTGTNTSGNPKPGVFVTSQASTGSSASIALTGTGTANIVWSLTSFALIPAPEGTTHEQSFADREGLTDTSTIIQNHTTSQADREGLTDAHNTTMNFLDTIADREGIQDVVSLAQTEPESFADPLGLTDSMVAGLLLPHEEADIEGLTDSVDISRLLESVTSVDTEGLTDSFTEIQEHAQSPEDALGLLDDLLVYNPNDLNFADVLAASDNVIQALSMANTVQDTGGTTDIITITLGYWEGEHVPHSSPGFGEIYIDRFFLVEKEKATESNDGKLSIAGQESSPPTTVSLVTFLHGQVVGLQEGKLVPVVFRDKSERNAYYSIGNTSSELTDYQSGVYGDNTVATADWTIELERMGSDSEVDLQSRLTGAIRANDFALTGQKWHAPAVDHYAYYTGATNPSTITRETSDGEMTVYVDIPDNVSPKWGCAVEDYHKGRVRILDTREVTIENEVEGLNRNISATGWSIMNGLINITPTASAGVLNFSTYDGSSFRDKYVNITVGGSNIAQWSSATILRNDFEQCIVRLVSAQTDAGRTTVDLGLKRGSRVVEGYVQTGSSSTLTVHAATAESNISNFSSAGYVTRSTNDDDDLRFVAGSARSFSSHANGGVSKSSTTKLDFFWGATLGAGTTNDTAIALRNQYIGSMPEVVYAVRR